MKLTNTLSMKRKSGMTLLELTVVILVLLSLISILFIGARAWKKGSDRSANILNIRNVQQAVRGHQNTKELADGAGLVGADLWTTSTNPGGYLAEPKAPNASGGTYVFGTVVPVAGTLYITNPELGKPVGEYFYTAAEKTAKTSDW